MVDACGAWTPETLDAIPNAVKKLCELLKGTDTRLLIVGGAGSLYVNKEHTLTVADGKMTAEITWSSPNYDYMIVDGEKYLPVNTEGNSVFEIPVAALDTALAVTADTTAMSTPHEIEYTLTFDSASLTA